MNAQLQQQNNELLQKQHEIKMAELEIQMQKLRLEEQELQRKLKEGNDNFAVQVAKLESEAERNQADASLKNAQEIKTLAEAEKIANQPVEVPNGMREEERRL